MPHRTQTPEYHRWCGLQANRHVSGEILKLAARLGLNSTAANEWAAGVLAASGSKSPGQVLRSAWLAVLAEQLASPGAATAKSPLTLGEIRGLASGALPAKAGTPTGQVPPNALPATPALPSAQDPAVVAWVPRARSLIGGSNIPKAIVEAVRREILADPQFKPTGNREAAAQALATAAFKQANSEYLADVKKVSAAAKALEEILNQPSAQELAIHAAAATLRAALRADNATSLPTEMTRVALRFAMDRRLNPNIRARFDDHARGHGFQTDVSTAPGRTGLTYPQAMVSNPQQTDPITAGLMARLGLAKEIIGVGFLEVGRPGRSAEATLNQEGIITRLESAPLAVDEGDKEHQAHPAQVLYYSGGNHNLQLRLAAASMSPTQLRQAEDEYLRAPHNPSMPDLVTYKSELRNKFLRDSLNSLTQFGRVVGVAMQFLQPSGAREMLEAITKNPQVIFVMGAGNENLELSKAALAGQETEGKILRIIENSNQRYSFSQAKNQYIDQRVRTLIESQQKAFGNQLPLSEEFLRNQVEAQTENQLGAYYISLFAKHKNVVVVGTGDLNQGVARFSGRDPLLVDISVPGSNLLYPIVSGRTGRGAVTIEGTSFSVPVIAKAFAYAQRMSMLSPTDPGLLPEELIEMAVSTADKDSRFVGVNRAGGPVNADRFKQTAALVGQLRKVLTAVPSNESAAQKSARELADTELVQSTGKRLGIKPDRLAEIAPLAVDMARRVNTRLKATSP